MSSIAPDAPRPEAQAQRPRYVVVALIAALVFAAECWTSGCERLHFYRGESLQTSSVNSAIHDEAARTRADALFQHFVDIAEAARGRAVPLAAATFVLGAALLVLAARGLAGRSNTRSILIQIIAVQAIVVASTYYLTREVRNAEYGWWVEACVARDSEVLPASDARRWAHLYRGWRRWGPPAWLAFRTLGSALILVALSRPRAREFFEAAARDPHAAER